MSTQKKNAKKRGFIRKLSKHYRLVIMNDDNFEIKTSIKLTPLNVLFITSTISLIFAVIVIAFIVLTPIRQSIPGYGYRDYLKSELLRLKLTTDSMEHVLNQQVVFRENLMNLLLDMPDTTKESIIPSIVTYDSLDLESASIQDSILRKEFELKETFGLFEGGERRVSTIEEKHFFPPLKGIITKEFNINNHFGIDIVSEESASIKAALDGKVIFADWTFDDGNVIALQHGNNLLSLYKHNSVLLKKVGSFVKAGDAIAIIGDSGEYSQGPHLHFELWHNQAPLDPMSYINFN